MSPIEKFDTKAQEIHNDGYTVLRNAFTQSEIQSLRDVFLDYFRSGDFINIHGGKSKPDFLKSRHLQHTSWILANEKVSNLIKAILGNDIVFCEHSDAHFNISNHWHKDVELPSANDPWTKSPNESPYRILKVALYLQTHDSDRNYALKFRKGSHLHEDTDLGEEVQVNINMGDAVIFDCRTTHMGHKNPLTRNALSEFLINSLKRNRRHAKVLHDYRHLEERRRSQRFLNRIEYHLLRAIDALRGKPDRISLFYTFGAPNEHTEAHILSSKVRQDIQNGAAANEDVSEYRTHLDSVGIRY